MFYIKLFEELLGEAGAVLENVTIFEMDAGCGDLASAVAKCKLQHNVARCPFYKHCRWIGGVSAEDCNRIRVIKKTVDDFAKELLKTTKENGEADKERLEQSIKEAIANLPKVEDSLRDVDQQVTLKRNLTLAQSAAAECQIWQHGSGCLDVGRAQHLNSARGNNMTAEFMPDMLAVSSALLNSHLAFWSSAK